MTPDADEPAAALQFRDLRRELWKRIFVFTKPLWTALGFFVDDAVRRKVIELGVVVHFAVLIPVVLAKWSAVVHDQRGRLRNTGLRKHLQDILVKRRNRQSVFVAV